MPATCHDAGVIIITGTITIDPAKAKEAADAAREVMAATRQEAGCVSYSFSPDFDDPSTVYITERWADEDAVNAHMATPHLSALMAKMGELGVSAVDLMRYEADDGKPLFG
jgi:quinol monooxygenase YgiN